VTASYTGRSLLLVAGGWQLKTRCSNSTTGGTAKSRSPRRSGGFWS
jgi:hypothetical protein